MDAQHTNLDTMPKGRRLGTSTLHFAGVALRFLVMISEVVGWTVASEVLFDSTISSSYSAPFIVLSCLAVIVFTMKVGATPILSLANPAPPFSEDTVNKTAQVIRKRATSLRALATVSLAGLIVSLLSGLAVFIFADQITNIRFLQRGSLVSIIKSQENRIDDTNSELRVLGQNVDHAISTLKNSDPTQQDAAQEFNDRISRVGSEMRKNEDEMRSFLTDMQQSLLDNTDPNKGKDPQAALLARLGSVVILFLAVQVFGRLYRFNLALAGDYDTTADALQLWMLKPLDEGFSATLKAIKLERQNLEDVKSPLEYLFQKATSAKRADHNSRKQGSKSGAAEEAASEAESDPSSAGGKS